MNLDERLVVYKVQYAIKLQAPFWHWKCITLKSQKIKNIRIIIVWNVGQALIFIYYIEKFKVRYINIFSGTNNKKINAQRNKNPSWHI